MGSLSARANKVPVVGRRLQGTCRKTGDFFSLDVPLGKACQGICQSPICSSVMDSPVNSPIQGRQGPKGSYNAAASRSPARATSWPPQAATQVSSPLWAHTVCLPALYVLRVLEHTVDLL